MLILTGRYPVLNPDIPKKSITERLLTLRDLLAAVAGGTAAIAVLHYAASLTAGNPWKQWLIYVAPLAAVIVGMLTIWLIMRLVRPQRKTRERQRRYAAEEYLRYLEEKVNDPDTAERSRERYRKRIEIIKSEGKQFNPELITKW